MALPANITVLGKLLRADNTPEVGRVVFSTSTTVLYSGDETVMVPSGIAAVLDETGSFQLEIPASNDPAWSPVGWEWKVSTYLSSGRNSFYTVIPYDAPGGEIWLSELTPALEGGSDLYAAFSHTHEGIGGVADWDELINKPATFPPSTHTHPESDVVGLTAALGGKAPTVHSHAVSDISGLQATLDSKADDSDISALDTRVDALEADTGSTMVVRRSKITSGNIVPQNTAGVWDTLTGGPTLTIPAEVGDYVEFGIIGGMRSLPSASMLDIVVLNAGSRVRYSSTGTGTPALEGDPTLYPNPSEFLGAVTVFEFVAEAGDINTGTITFGFATKSNGTGTLYASTDYPLRLRAVNYGPADVS